MWTFILDMLQLCFFFFLHNCPLLIPLYNTAVLIIICRFLINVVKLCKLLSKLDLQTLRKGSTEERTQRNKCKNLTLANTRIQVLDFSSADALPTNLRVPLGRT